MRVNNNQKTTIMKKGLLLLGIIVSSVGYAQSCNYNYNNNQPYHNQNSYTNYIQQPQFVTYQPNTTVYETPFGELFDVLIKAIATKGNRVRLESNNCCSNLSRSRRARRNNHSCH